jgi:hypothetical protein
MKKLSLLALGFLFELQIHAQSSNVILFTENGERFTAILNGIRQNDKPETNVKITGLNAEFYKLKVIFESTALGEKNFNMAIQLGMENTYVIKKNNKGEFVLRFMSAVPLAEAPRNTPQQTVVVYHENPVAAPAPVETTQTITTTTTTTGGAAPVDPNAVNINMGMNVNGMGGGINISVSGMDAGMVQESSTTVTHTTTTTTTSGSMSTPPPPPPAPIAYVPGYNGPIGCPVPMSPEDFGDLKQSISSKSFEETKFTMAKQVLQDRCMTVSQVKQMMLLFTFEQTRLDFAKFAYDRTYDIGNYFKVNDAFTFESSIEELNEYMNARR